MGLSAFCFHNWDGLVTWALPAEDHVTSALGAQTKWPPGTHGIRIYNMENVFLQGPHGICPNFEIFFVHIAKHTCYLSTLGAQPRSPVGTHGIKITFIVLMVKLPKLNYFYRDSSIQSLLVWQTTSTHPLKSPF